MRIAGRPPESSFSQATTDDMWDDVFDRDRRSVPQGARPGPRTAEPLYFTDTVECYRRHAGVTWGDACERMARLHGCAAPSLRELHRDRKTLHAMRDRATAPAPDPVRAEKLYRLEKAIHYQADRVRQAGRSEPAEMSIARIVKLALNDAPHIPPLAREIAGDQFEGLVSQLARQAW